MNKAKIGMAIASVGIALATWLSVAAPVKPQQAVESENPFKGAVFYKNPVTGNLALYFAFEFEPGHEYSVQVTTDGINWSEVEHVNMKGVTHEVYESFNVPDPCNGIWPRVIDLGI